MITYEFPLNEQVRTLLKLERLFQQVLALTRHDDALSHQTALCTLFDLMDIASRNEVRQELQMELVRIRQRLETGSTSENEWLKQIDQAQSALHELPARLDHMTRDSEWLGAVRQRSNAPGGINSFDLPYYHYWQNKPSQNRRADLVSWISPALPVHQAINLILRRLRNLGSPQAIVAQNGFYQQMINGRNGQLLRMALDSNLRAIPEVSASRHAINIRFVDATAAGHAQFDEQVEFQLCFCEA